VAGGDGKYHWDNASNWSPYTGNFPVTGDDVTLDNNTTEDCVADGANSIGNLTLASTIPTGAKLIMDNALTVSGTFTMEGGTISEDNTTATLSIVGGVWEGGSIGASTSEVDTLYVGGNLGVKTSPAALNGWKFEVQNGSTVTFDKFTGANSFALNGNMQIDSGGTVNLNTSIGFNSYGLNKSGAGDYSISDAGTLALQESAFTMNTLPIYVSGAGLLKLGQDTTLYAKGGSTLTNSYGVEQNGSLSAIQMDKNSTLKTDNGVKQIDGAIEASNGGVTFAGDLTIASSGAGEGLYLDYQDTNGGASNTYSLTQITGSLALGSGSTLNVWVKVGGITPNSNLAVLGNVSIDAAANLKANLSGTPPSVYTWTIIDATGFTINQAFTNADITGSGHTGWTDALNGSSTKLNLSW
jgi:hypothetical protein